MSSLPAVVPADARLRDELTHITRAAAVACQAEMSIVGILRNGTTRVQIVSDFGDCTRHFANRLAATNLRTLIRAPGLVFCSGDVLSDPHPVARRLRIDGDHAPRAIVLTPLWSREGPLGVMSVARVRAEPFANGELSQLALIAEKARNAIRLKRVSTTAPASAEADRKHAQSIDSLPRLTPREREIIRLLAADRSCKQVASYLGLSPRTVEHHVERLKFRHQQTTLHGLIGYMIRRAT